MKRFLCSSSIVVFLGASVAAAQDNEGSDTLSAAYDPAEAGQSAGAANDFQVVGDVAPYRVDILVAYTPAARAYAGSTSAMKAAINTYVAGTNLAYTKSDINVVLKLAGTAEAGYSENGDMSVDLSRLRSTSDSYLTSVPGLRNTHGADLVCLIRRDAAAGVAGIAYLGNLTSGFAASAYSVVADVWALGNNSFAHELGHNFGCHHDHANGSGASRAYAYGHRFNGTNNIQYRTIMAYAPGSRIPYFSNPSVAYQGTATGVSGTGGTAADNARLIEESAPVTGAFRGAVTRSGSRVRGDFDGDGTPDIVLYNSSTYQVAVRLMSGFFSTSTVSLGGAASGWQVATVGDLNGDGSSDLVWENTNTGERAVWFMRGTTRIGGAALPTVSTAWHIAASGDFNRDGRDDLVLENTTSASWGLWYMNAYTVIGTAGLPAATSAWRVVGTGDLNADGRADLIWENPSDGSRAYWVMNNTARIGGGPLPSAPVAWKIGAVADFNGDLRPDLILENTTDGSLAYWAMNGVSRVGGGLITTLSSGWHVVNH